jgi:hypothetical protein
VRIKRRNLLKAFDTQVQREKEKRERFRAFLLAPKNPKKREKLWEVGGQGKKERRMSRFWRK